MNDSDKTQSAMATGNSPQPLQADSKLGANHQNPTTSFLTRLLAPDLPST